MIHFLTDHWLLTLFAAVAVAFFAMVGVCAWIIKREFDKESHFDD
jgi:hypothetical protein